MLAGASLFGFTGPYQFSISLTCGFAFRHGIQKHVFMTCVPVIWHLRGLNNKTDAGIDIDYYTYVQRNTKREVHSADKAFDAMLVHLFHFISRFL